jgi:hypothetical protein
MPSLRLEAGVANVCSTRSTSDGLSGVTMLPVVTSRRVVAPQRVRADRIAAHRDAPRARRALPNDRCIGAPRVSERGECSENARTREWMWKPSKLSVVDDDRVRTAALGPPKWKTDTSSEGGTRGKGRRSRRPTTHPCVA